MSLFSPWRNVTITSHRVLIKDMHYDEKMIKAKYNAKAKCFGKKWQFFGKYFVLTKWKILCVHRKCDALRDLVPFIQFQKREKHPLRSVTFSKVAG